MYLTVRQDGDSNEHIGTIKAENLAILNHMPFWYIVIFANNRRIPFEKMKEELDLCLLLCSNCHREIHYKK